MGITRGKNDKVDSLRIASYLLNNFRKLSLYAPLSDTVKQLKNWLVLRENLIKDRVAISLIINNFEREVESNLREHIKLAKKQKEILSGSIMKIDEKIKMLMEKDVSVKNIAFEDFETFKISKAANAMFFT